MIPSCTLAVATAPSGRLDIPYIHSNSTTQKYFSGLAIILFNNVYYSSVHTSISGPYESSCLFFSSDKSHMKSHNFIQLEFYNI